MPEAQVPPKVELTAELREEVRVARRCFTAMERLTTLMLAYPPGHPMIAEASENASRMFREFFELNDRLSVMIYPHSMKLLGTDEAVWETEEPRDYCWALNRDGVYLLHILAGIDGAEVRRLVDVFNELVDERDLTRDAVTALFEADFRYVSHDAIDESLAALADIELDIRDRDTREEQEDIEELFNECFDKESRDKLSPQEAARKHQEEFHVRMEKRAERQQRIKMGSREFLRLSREQQEHLLDLRRGFTEHAELEHREGEVLAAILGANPKPVLRDSTIEQIGEVMGGLLETNQPWESLELLKLIHQWREKFDPTTVEALKDAVQDCFNNRRLMQMMKLVTHGTPEVRRAVLQMLNALHLDEASPDLARMLAWDLEDEVRNDIVRYLRERSRYGLGFLREALSDMPPDRALPLLDIARAHLPRSRPFFLEILENPTEPQMKGVAVQALAGHIKPDEAQKYLAPLLRAPNPDVRIAALRGLADAAPDKVVSVLAPLFNNKLRERPESEVGEMATIFVRLGGPTAIVKLRDLIQVRGMMVGEAERELAIQLATVLARNATPQTVALLGETAKDWRVNGKVRTACKDLHDILSR